MAGAVALLLALPAAADAAYVGGVVAGAPTLTGDDAADTLTLTVQGGNLAHDLGAPFNSPIDFNSTEAGDQVLPANGSTTLVVLAGGGADTVNASGLAGGQIGTFVVDGGPGGDTLTGTGIGDRIIGGTGDDVMNGGDGNDVLVWNNGDNSDTMNGEGGGFDEIEVNGAPAAGDTFTFAAGAEAGRVTFQRTNLVPFTLDVSAERMLVNGLGGPDTMTGAAGLASALTLNGGVGTDTITGSEGADLITGGEEADTLNGGGGDDRIVGDRGNDTMAGGGGDDTLVWNNGDNNDVMDGQDGVDVVEVNGAGGGDTFTLAPNGPRARFDRTNLVPFNLDIATSEVLEVNGLAGDDRFSAAAGTESLIEALHLHGGSGADTLGGGASNDIVMGGSGNDTLDGGPGADDAHGGAGDDTLNLRDAGPDLGACGAGNDRATADGVGVDALIACETADQPPATDVSATAVQIRTSRVAFRRSTRRPRVWITVECPAAETGGCRGALTLATRRAQRLGRVRARVILGVGRFTVGAGQTARVRIRLARGAARLARRGRIDARVFAVSRDAAGNTAESSRRVRVTVRR